MPLENRNNAPHSVFVPSGDSGLFRRYNGMTGRPMDASTADGHGLFDRDGLRFGTLPATMALDAAPQVFNDRPDPRPPTSGSNISQRQSTDQGAGVAQKISASRARQIWELLQSKLSPQDLAQAAKLLEACIDPSLPDEPEAEVSETHPEPSMRPPMAADLALAFAEPNADLRAALSSMARIGRDTYGLPVPKSSYRREAKSRRLALDERTRASGSSLEDFARDWPEVARIGHAY